MVSTAIDSTELDDPADSVAPVRDRPPSRTAATPSWRLAARLARREVRRRPGRTALVMFLVAIPVAAMTFASVIARTIAEPPEAGFAREFGTAGVVVVLAELPIVGGSPAADLAARIDARFPGVATTAVERSYDTFVPADRDARTVNGELRALDLDDPILRGVVAVEEGRVAAAPGEVAVSSTLAATWEVEVGDELVLDRPDVVLDVAGIVTPTHDRGASMLFVGPGTALGPASFPDRMILVGEPSPSPEQVRGLAADVSSVGGVVRSPAEQTARGVGATQVAWGWVAGALGLTVLGIVVTAAFATSARRQLVTLGQLTANGASPGLLRRTLSMQGAWSGLFGSLLGVGLAAVALALGRTTFVTLNRWDPGPYVVSWADLVVIVGTGTIAATVAAFVPARTASRIPVLAALAGRRPVGRVPRRLVPWGLGLFGGGVALLGVTAATVGDGGGSGAGGDAQAAAAIIGGLGVLAGACCASPIVAAAFGALGERLRGSARLAARSLARSRTRTAAIVTAVAAVGAVAVAVATGVDSRATNEDTDPRYLPDDVVLIEPSAATAALDDPENAPEPSFAPLDEAQLADVEAMFPDGALSVARAATYDPAPWDEQRTSTKGQLVNGDGIVPVADAPTLELLGLSAPDRAALERTGALYVPAGGLGSSAIPPVETGSTARFTLDREGAPVEITSAVARDRPRRVAGLWGGGLVLTPERADRLGLRVADWRYVLQLDHSLTDADRRAVSDLGTRLNLGYDGDIVPVGTIDGPAYVNVEAGVERGISGRQVGAIVVILLGLLAIGVVGVALALSAAESQDERRLLVAMGASPSTMRATAAVTAGLLSSAGFLLAVPTGLAPAAVVLSASRQDWESGPAVQVPVALIVAFVVAVPLLAAAVAWSATALGPRRRPAGTAAPADD